MHFVLRFRRCVLAIALALAGSGFIVFPINSLAEEIPEETAVESFSSAVVEEFDKFDIDDDGASDSEDPEVIVDTNITLPAGEYNYQKLIVRNNAVLTLAGDPLSGESFKGVSINAVELIAESGSIISANAKGYRGGPGAPPASNPLAGANYGGAGDGSSLTQIYGSATQPLDLGSSGNVPNTYGGGAIQLHTNILQNDGIISANGDRSSSGGSLYVVAGAISGNGIFQANGGRLGTTAQTHGPGGGGRVAIYYENLNFTGKAEAKGGCGSYDGFSAFCAENGTVGLIDKINNNLYVNFYWQFQTEDSPMIFNDILISNGAKVATEVGAKITAQNMTLTEGSLMTLVGEETIQIQSLLVQGNSKITVLPERTLFLEIPRIIIEAGSKISADGKGYEKGPGAPDAPNTAGASYGGKGGGVLAKPVYGSAENPTDFGSSSHSFRLGGGAVRIIATDFLQNDGIITASARRQIGSSDEVNSERASGGSVYITAGKLTGAGTFRADGGNTSYPYAGIAGGGGRIAIYYQENNFTGTTTAKAGTYCFSGCGKAAEDGTIIIAEDIPDKNPILIVPGVLGTEIFNGGKQLWLNIAENATDVGDEFMDPLAFTNNLISQTNGLILGDIVRKKELEVLGRPVTLFDYSEKLIEEFIGQGYVEGTDLFTFPYDWRYGVHAINVESLKEKINDILAQTGARKVDIVAHSNGGLVVKKYIIENSTSHHIDKTVFVGVPNTGAPKAVKALIVGDSFGNPFLSQEEMKKLAKNLPVVYDLLPSREYYDKKGSFIQTVIQPNPLQIETKDLNFEEADIFLLNDYSLNSLALDRAHDLHTSTFDNYDLRDADVDPYNIIGCKAGTIGKVVRKMEGTSLSYNLEMTPGDGTVPLESATNLPITENNRYLALEAKHSTMMTQDGIRQQIVNILTGSSLPTNSISQDISDCKLNGKAIAIYSPVAIDVTDQENNHLGFASDGVSVENEIPNASFEVLGEEKFVYLPDEPEYQIFLSGTGVGTFTLIYSDIENNENVSEQAFVGIPVTTQTTGEILISGASIELELDVTGDGTPDFTILPSAEFDPILYLQIVKTTISSFSLPEAKKKAFSNKIDGVIKKIQQGKIDKAKLKAEKFKIKMEKRIEKIDKKPKPKQISKADAQLLLDMFNKLLDNLN